MKNVCVFCGSSRGRGPTYAAVAAAMGQALAKRGIGLVYGGGHIGLMGLMADAALQAGGRVVGVIPGFLKEKELGHSDLTELVVVHSMHERKAVMASLSDAFVALPGGFGTVEEFCEALTWAQLGLHHKPCGLLNTRGFFSPLLAFFDLQVEEGFLFAEYRKLVISEEDPERLLDRLSELALPEEHPEAKPEDLLFIPSMTYRSERRRK